MSNWVALSISDFSHLSLFAFLLVWPYVPAFPSRQVGKGAKDSRKMHATKNTVEKMWSIHFFPENWEKVFHYEILASLALTITHPQDNEYF